MGTKQLTQSEINEIENLVKDFLDMYSPKVTIVQTKDHRVIWREEQNGSVNEWENIVCDIVIISNKGNLKKIMDFHPSLDRDSIAKEIAKKFFDEIDRNITGPLANKLWG